MNLSDKEILKLIAHDESREQGFMMLVKEYQQRLYWHIRRMLMNHDDADDVLQDTFIKVWKGLPKFRHDSQLYTWLYRIATNESLAFLKKQKRLNALSFSDAELFLSSGIVGNDGLSGDEISMKLQKAILTLPAKQRLVFNMKYFEEMKYREMSEVLGTSVGALKASYHLAVKKIERQVLKD